MADFGEILKRFKESEEPENLVAIINDTELQNGIIAWKGVNIQFNGLSECPETNPSLQWDWLWKQIKFTEDRFGTIAGVNAQNVRKLFTRLKGFRLIYPDGTINSLASQYLQTIVMGKLKSAMPRSKTTSRPPVKKKKEGEE